MCACHTHDVLRWFWHDSGIMLACCLDYYGERLQWRWYHSGMTLALCGHHVGPILELFWNHVGILLVSFWHHPCDIVWAHCWHYFGIGLWSFVIIWDSLGIKLAPCRHYFDVMLASVWNVLKPFQNHCEATLASSWHNCGQRCCHLAYCWHHIGIIFE